MRQYKQIFEIPYSLKNMSADTYQLFEESDSPSIILTIGCSREHLFWCHSHHQRNSCHLSTFNCFILILRYKSSIMLRFYWWCKSKSVHPLVRIGISLEVKKNMKWKNKNLSIFFTAFIIYKNKIINSCQNLRVLYNSVSCILS